MSTHVSNIRNSPLIVTLPPRGAVKTQRADHPTHLPVAGQGTVRSHQPADGSSFQVILSGPEGAFRLEVERDNVIFWEQHGQEATRLAEFNGEGLGLDADESCPFWFSLSTDRRRLRYGKGEPRKLTTLAEHVLPPKEPEKDDPYAWIRDIRDVGTSPGAHLIEIWRDPVTIEPPAIVVPSDEMTMEAAANSWATVPGGLTAECQQLHDTVAGANFVMDTPDFPEFSAAIEASIGNPNGWCYKKLESKAGEFGGGKKDIKGTYLRITMGINQGNSPGVPYVMEIWPGGHFSPIHDHADCHAIIRVLHGALTARLFSFLSHHHRTPFAEKVLSEGDVTWLAPRLNQTHQLYNHHENGPTCITIQCYSYGRSNNAHYEYFDYLTPDGSQKQFEPTSDMDYLEFKALMRREWQGDFSGSEVTES
ncbi:MAG: hypothetical protein AAF533_15860 [Acidobacteriota bacterium]